MCEKVAQSFYAACPAETGTHDLSLASPILYRQRHDATSLRLRILGIPENGSQNTVHTNDIIKTECASQGTHYATKMMPAKKLPPNMAANSLR